MHMRLDKFLNDATGIGRSTIKKEIRYGKVNVNGTVVKTADMQIDPSKDTVLYDGSMLRYAEHYYYLMNKPAGVVSATNDARERTVTDLLQEDIPAHIKSRLFPVGRLDKDTEGLLLLTDDGAFAHRLLSPAHHAEKTYYCRLEHAITDTEIDMLENGMDIGEKRLTKPAVVRRISDTEVDLTITEGKFHQVKRMLAAVGNQVLYLKRIKMGDLSLPDDLAPGAYRLLTDEEKKQLNG